MLSDTKLTMYRVYSREEP
uniref:Uncharacterized protein n=1 Tax=Nymphaea colorata TaxID=210225 RepID=A0A5K1BJ90_9MAGN